MAANKDNLVSRLSHAFANLSVWSLKHRWIVFGLCMSILAVCLYMASIVRMDNGFETFFNEGDPAYTAYLQYREDFGSDEVALIAYDASEYPEGVFDIRLMNQIHELTVELEKSLPFVKEVKSLSNAEIMVGDEDGLNIIELYQEFPLSQKELNSYADLIMSKPFIVDGLVSKDGKIGAIQIDMHRSSIDAVEDIKLDPDGGEGLENLYPQVTDTVITQVISQEKYKNLKLYISGDVPLNSEFNRVAYEYMYLCFGLCFLAIGILLLFFFKGKVIGVIGPLAVVFLAILMTVGFISIMGWDIDMLFGMAPTLLAAVGVANAVHIISEFRYYYAQTADRQEALKRTFYLVGTPCLITSATTAAGFMALAISPIKAIEHMAVYTSFAVISAFFLSITFLTFFLSFGKKDDAMKLEKSASSPVFDKLLESIAHFNIRHPKKIVTTGLITAATFIFGIQYVVVDSNFLLDFDESVEVRVSTEYIDDNLGGVGSLVFLIETGVEDAIKRPEVLKSIETFQNHVNQYSIVQKSYSIVDLLKDINQSFNGGNPEYYVIPEDQDLVAQYLLVYEFSGGEELRNFVSDDYSRTAIEVRTPLSSTQEVDVFQKEIDQYLKKNPIIASQTTFTGIWSLWVQLADYITESQITGVLLAFVVITIMMCFIFQSIKVGFISMIPNTTPALMTVGLIGWLGIPLDFMKLMIAPVALGIAVDDTIHLITRFHHEFKRLGNYNQALISAMRDVGKALVITSTVLIVGFMFFTISPLNSQQWFGILLATTILVALIADFFIMPAMVLLMKPFGPEFKPSV